MSAILVGLLLSQDWKYVAPAEGADMDHAPLLALETSTSKPDRLTESVVYRGKHRVYAQIRFGSPSSVRVAMVLDVMGDRSALYVDRNRDRVIHAEDLIPGDGPLWRFSLDALELGVDGVTTTKHKREVVVRKGRQRGRLSMATIGYLEGMVELDGKKVLCRRSDDDGNGCFGDPADRILFDLDRNGAFDPISERFPISPILMIANRRYAAHGDPWKGRLSFTAIEGEGTLAIGPPKLKAKADVKTANLGLAGRDGTPTALAFGVRTAAPPGDFRQDTLKLVLTESPHSDWQYTFAYRGGKPEVWHELRRNETLTLDPVGELSFSIESQDAENGVRAGEQIMLQLRLFTGDGLLINEVLRNAGSDVLGAQPTAQVTLQTTDGRILGETSSGFA